MFVNSIKGQLRLNKGHIRLKDTRLNKGQLRLIKGHTLY